MIIDYRLNTVWPDEVSRSSDIYIKVKVSLIDWRQTRFLFLSEQQPGLDWTGSELNRVWTEPGLDWTGSGLNQVCEQNSLSLLWSFTASVWLDSDLHVVSSPVSIILRCLMTDLIFTLQCLSQSVSRAVSQTLSPLLLFPFISRQGFSDSSLKYRICNISVSKYLKRLNLCYICFGAVCSHYSRCSLMI